MFCERPLRRARDPITPFDAIHHDDRHGRWPRHPHALRGAQGPARAVRPADARVGRRGGPGGRLGRRRGRGVAGDRRAPSTRVCRASSSPSSRRRSARVTRPRSGSPPCPTTSRRWSCCTATRRRSTPRRSGASIEARAEARRRRGARLRPHRHAEPLRPDRARPERRRADRRGPRRDARGARDRRGQRRHLLLRGRRAARRARPSSTPETPRASAT